MKYLVFIGATSALAPCDYNRAYDPSEGCVNVQYDPSNPLCNSETDAGCYVLSADGTTCLQADSGEVGVVLGADGTVADDSWCVDAAPAQANFADWCAANEYTAANTDCQPDPVIAEADAWAFYPGQDGLAKLPWSTRNAGSYRTCEAASECSSSVLTNGETEAVCGEFTLSSQTNDGADDPTISDEIQSRIEAFEDGYCWSLFECLEQKLEWEQAYDNDEWAYKYKIDCGGGTAANCNPDDGCSEIYGDDCDNGENSAGCVCCSNVNLVAEREQAAADALAAEVAAAEAAAAQALLDAQAEADALALAEAEAYYSCDYTYSEYCLSCDDSSGCSENSYCATSYTEYCECCPEDSSYYSDVDADLSLAVVSCVTDAECAASTAGATSCGTPMLDGVAGGPATCVSPLVCGVESTVGTTTSTVSCGGSNLMLAIAATLLSIYMAI